MSLIKKTISGLLAAISATNISATAIALEVAMPESLRPQHPLSPNVDHSTTLMQVLAPTLLVGNERNEWVCQLCAPDSKGAVATTTTHKKNRRRYIVSTWTLRRDLKWGDGTPVTNQDILLTWQIIQTTRHPAFTDLLATVVDMRPDEKDHYTLHAEHRGTLEHFAAAFAGIRLIPSHLESQIWRDQGGNFASYLQKSNYQTAPQNPGLFAGIYAAASSPEANQRLSLHSTTNGIAIVGTLAKKLNIHRLSSPDETPKFLQKQTSILIESDFAFAHRALRSLKQSRSQAHITTQTSNWLEYISFNTRNPLLADTRVRQALIKSIDRKQLMQIPGINEAALARGLFPDFDVRFADISKLLSYDIDSANQLLNDSGWLISAKDQRRWRGDTQLRFDIVFDGSADYRREVVAILAQSWQKLGISIEQTDVRSSRVLAKRLRKIDYTGVALFARHMDLDITPAAIFSSKAIPSTDNDYRGSNFAAWRSSAVDNAMEQIDDASTSAARLKGYQLLALHFAKDAPGAPLFFHPKVLLTPHPVSKIKTFVGDIPGILRLCNLF